MKKYKFCFDLDGTIAETEELHRRAYNSIFSDEGINWNWSKKLYKELLKVTGGKERLKHYKENFNSKNYHLDINDISRIHSKKMNYITNGWMKDYFSSDQA